VENERGTVAAKYSFNGSTPLANRQAILFVPSSSGGLAVSPATDLTASGLVGGPFAPNTQTYTIENTGTASLDWAVGKTASWLSLSVTSGSLAPGQRADVTVMINANANSLPAGSYFDTLSFVNQNNGLGNTTRAVSLTVNGTTGVLTVTPDSGFTATGTQGGPFGAVSQIYTLINTGDATLDWTATKNGEWLSLSTSSGALAAGASTTVTVSINGAASQLAPGTYSDVIQFANLTNGKGDTSRAATLIVSASPGMLAVAPTTDLNASGFVGGPFTPSAQVHTLSNTGGASLNWEVVVDQPWVSLSSTTGTLAAGESVEVTVSLNAEANSLVAGSYTATVNFENTTAGQLAASTAVNLTVNPAPGQLVMTPEVGFRSSGFTGGPFDPTEQTFTLSNSGGTPFDWSASKRADWLSLSVSRGTLAPGASTTVTLSLSDAAALLGAGTHTDTLVLTNLTNGQGNTTRTVSLTVSARPGVLSVTPLSDFGSGGIVGGPFTPTQTIYILSNSGGSALDWRATASAPWLSFFASAGSLAPGQHTEVTVSVNDQAAALASGTHSASIEFKDAPAGTVAATRTVTLVISPPPGRLVVTAEPGWSASGFVGGPFSPESQSYTLSNTGGASLEWTANANQPWLSLSPSNGVLAPDEGVAVTVTLNSEAAALPAGNHRGSIAFSVSGTDEASIARQVSLEVKPRQAPTLGLGNNAPTYPFTLHLTGDPHTDYVIEATSDFSAWLPITTNRTAADGSLTLTDASGPPAGPRFYRARLAP
jgi:hypothetical protein